MDHQNKKPGRNECELYVHIPFCVKKCNYCDFLSFPAGEKEKEHYLECLNREITRKADLLSTGTVISSVFIGGGTPSVLQAAQIGRILETIAANYTVAEDAEITIECNPGTAGIEELYAYRRFGINRISFGLQSADNAELKILGRIHTWEQFVDSYQAARRAGFTNCNVDVMMALPGQTYDSYSQTLGKVLAISPEHISAYSLIVEEGTPFFKQYQEDVLQREQGRPTRFLPGEETERQMYDTTLAQLAAKGYVQYEISNFARPGYACRHNTGYWRRIPYLGFGPGAASLLEETRFSNTEDIREYVKYYEKGSLYVQEKNPAMTRQEQMEETMFLGLRMNEGVDRQAFYEKFGERMEQVYAGAVEKLIKEGLLFLTPAHAALTKKGFDLANYCMSQFLF